MNGTILSSLYPDLKIARSTAEEIERMPENLKKNPSKTGMIEISDGTNVLVKDFLPPYVCENAGIEIGFDLLVEERDADDEEWVDMKTRKGVDPLTGKPLEPRRGLNHVFLECWDSELEEYKLVNSKPLPTVTSRDQGQEKFRLKLKILMDRLPLMACASNSDDLHQRTVLFATELIGGYRILIQRLQALILERDQFLVAQGDSSDSEFHATYEDACRLICHFKFFAHVTDERSAGELEELKSGGAEAFENLRHRTEDYKHVCSTYSKLWRVRSRIVRRKLLEFSIYHQMIK